MINYRTPWFTLLGGSVLSLLGTAAPTGVAYLLFLAGGLLMIDGGLGIRVLPQLTPHACFPTDWLEIARRLYVGSPGKARFALATAMIALLALASGRINTGDWEIWFVVLSMIGWAGVWVVAALKAIRDTLANDI